MIDRVRAERWEGLTSPRQSPQHVALTARRAPGLIPELSLRVEVLGVDARRIPSPPVLGVRTDKAPHEVRREALFDETDY
jgi:hypothetical protein